MTDTNYVLRKEGGIWRAIIENSVEETIRRLNDYVKINND